MSVPPTDPLRIALVCNRNHPTVGGIETHVARQASALTRAGHEVTLLTHDLDGDVPDREEVAGTPVRRFLSVLPSPHSSSMASPTLARHLARSGDAYDIVHGHGHDTPAVLATRWWAGPLVISPHHHGTTGSGLRAALHVPHRRGAGYQALERADAVVCTSAVERRALLRDFPPAHDRAVVVTDGVDHLRLRAARDEAVTEAAATPDSDDRARILVVGRLEAYRRIDLAVSAVGQLRRTHRLEICGDGPDRSALEAQVVRLGLVDSVTFRGVVDDDALARSLTTAACIVDLTAHASRGTVLLDAAAVGTPIVASAIEAHLETHHRVGQLATLVPTDAGPRAVAAAIRRASTLPRHAVDVPSWDDVAWSLGDVYRRVLARSAARRRISA